LRQSSVATGEIGDEMDINDEEGRILSLVVDDGREAGFL
jgi:hypothetical protein